MKKYTSRAVKWLGLLSLLCMTLLVAGIVLIAVDFPNASLKFFLTAFGGCLGVLFGGCFFAERSRSLTIDGNTVTFPPGVERNGRMVFRRTVINLAEIASVESRLVRGDKIIAGDCVFHTIKLKDGTKVTVTLYAYGKDAEREIVERLKAGIS